MDNTWRVAQAQAQAQAQVQAQGQVQHPGQVMGGEGVAAQVIETGDWRTQLQPDSRERIVNKIMDTLKRHLPFSGQEGLQELKKIAVRFEEKIYTAATSQSDYLRKISLKMLTMETKSQNPMNNSLQSNAAGNSKNPQDTGSQSLQSQMQNQVPMVSTQPQVRQQLLPQSNMTSNIAPNSASMTSGLTQGNMPNVSGGQNSTMQNIQDINPNATGGTSMGQQQGVPFANSQRQIPGRQQQDQQQQQYLYNQQLQQHLMKQKLQQQGNIPQSLLQSQLQQQQQNLLQSGVMQQPSLRQSSSSSQNQQSSLQQQTQSMLQQSQSVLRPPQQQQVQQPQQQLSMMHQNSNTGNMLQNQMIGQQQNSILDQQQQRMMAQQNNMQQQQQQTNSQQNNLTNMHQQQLGQQNNLSGFQQQMVGSQHGNLGMQSNQQPAMLQQQSKVSSAPQQMQQNMLPNQQAQQSQSQPPQQQMMSQIQSQPGQLQQQMGLQQPANSLQRDMPQRMQQTPGSLLQQPAMIDQQKQLMQSQRIIPDAPLNSVDSSSLVGNTTGGDWQEEIFQKIKSMNEMYFTDLNEMYQRMSAKLQQHDSLPQQPRNEQLEKLRYFKLMLEKLIMFLQTNKNEIQPNHKEKMIAVEKQIVNILNSNRPRKPVSALQPGQQVPQSQMHAMQQPHMNQMYSHENQMSSQIQQMNTQGSVATMQQGNLTNLQHNSRQNNMDALQPGSNIDPVQGNAMNSMQQNPVSGPQQMNINSMSSQSGVTNLQLNVDPLQASTNILQPQHIKQEQQQQQQMFSTQQLKQQYQQRQMQQQYMNRQHLLQQQHQTTPQQSGQFPAQQIGQLGQINDPNDMKMRHQIIGKAGVLQQNQRPSYQQMKSGSSFSISSPQILQAASPQIGHHPSPQLDQQNLLSSHVKAGTPMQSVNSPFIVSSPSTSMVPSPMPGDTEKINPCVTSLSNAGNNLQQSNAGASVPAQSLAIGTPGISASPLLAEFTSPDGTHGVTSAIVSGNANQVEQPLDRLLKAVKSMSQKALSASVSDISSVVTMVDRIAGSAPGNGSRAAVGEDLVAMTKCRIQARNFFTQDGPTGSKKMRRYTSAMPSNVVSSTGSVNDSLMHLNGCESDGESSSGAPRINKHRLEPNHALEEEIREINQRLIDTVVSISEDDVDPTVISAAAGGGEGTIVRCSFSAVALSPDLKSQYASAQMSPIQPLRLLIPNDYPNCSPILLDNFPTEVSKEYEDLSIKAKSRFSISLRSLTQPMSLGEIAKTWDICARAVISEYAHQSGGGSFSSKYGTWETCLG